MCRIGSTNQSSIIGKSETLHGAREIARKNDGSEFIKREKDGSYSVQKLDDSEKNQVKQKPSAKFDGTVVEFSLQDQGNESIVTNLNGSMFEVARNVTWSNAVSAGEKVRQAGQYVEKKATNAASDIKSGVTEGASKVKAFVRDNLEFLSPVGEFLVNPFSQRDPVTSSSDSNCGPASGAIIAETFFPGLAKGKKNLILDVRNASTGPKAGALTEEQIIKGVESVTGGKVDGTVIGKDYKSTDAQKLLADINGEIKKGNLLMICTGFSKRIGGPRHYVSIVGVDKSGNLLISDPYKRPTNSPPDVWTPAILQERLDRTKTARNHNTSLVSFAKKP